MDFQYEGVVYSAVKEVDSSCNECSFNHNQKGCTESMKHFHCCTNEIFWIKKEKDFVEQPTLDSKPLATNKQEGGSHYQTAIQPIEYIHANGLNFFEGNVVKYVTRHKAKNKAEDIKKAIHYLELILQFEYPTNQESKV